MAVLVGEHPQELVFEESVARDQNLPLAARILDRHGRPRGNVVTLDQPDYFTEEFASSDNDLAGMKAIFIPDGSGDYYETCAEAITEYPTDPVGGTVLPLTLDDSDIVTPTTAMCSTVDFQRSRLPVTGFTRQAERSPRQN